jgi:hypothetical protein
MSRTPDLKRYAIWRECVRRQADRGLTIVQFCARERLSVATFQSWSKRSRSPVLRGLAWIPRVANLANIIRCGQAKTPEISSAASIGVVMVR